MRINEYCVNCLYDKQKALAENMPEKEGEAYLEEIRGLLANRTEKDTAPYMVHFAVYVGIDSCAEIVSNGCGIAGTLYDRLPKKAKEIDFLFFLMQMPAVYGKVWGAASDRNACGGRVEKYAQQRRRRLALLRIKRYKKAGRREGKCS